MLVPAFHAQDGVSSSKGTGKFILYHGNLGVGVNNFAALYLVNDVFSKLDIPCVIAGSNPSDELKKALIKYPHIKLVDNWNNEQIMFHASAAQKNNDNYLNLDGSLGLFEGKKDFLFHNIDLKLFKTTWSGDSSRLVFSKNKIKNQKLIPF